MPLSKQHVPETGRGFAVVADEVRALAHRTGQSTQEIELMIAAIRAGTDSVVKATALSTEEAGRTLGVAREAGAMLDNIAASVAIINERTVMIATAAEQQAQVAREVDRSLMAIRDPPFSRRLAPIRLRSPAMNWPDWPPTSTIWLCVSGRDAHTASHRLCVASRRDQRHRRP